MHSQMLQRKVVGCVMWVTVGLALASTTNVADARPEYGDDCSSCHSGDEGPQDPNQTEWFNTDNLLLPLDRITRKLDRDDILAATDPPTSPITDELHCGPGDRVVGVTINRESRAYSEGLLSVREVINDTVGGVPIAVTYCPLVDSFTVFDRRIGGEILEFGVSGMLDNSNLIMYDRTHLALWPQLRMNAVSGPHAGESMGHLPHVVVDHEEWAAEHPDSEIMVTYNFPIACVANSYDDYFADEDRISFPVSPWDDRLPPKEHIVGLVIDDMIRAYPLVELAKVPGGILREEFSGGDLVLEWEEGWGEVRVHSVPDGAQVVAPSFWFSWAANHEGTEIFSVPEPNAALMMAFGGLMLLLRRRSLRLSPDKS